MLMTNDEFIQSYSTFVLSQMKASNDIEQSIEKLMVAKIRLVPIDW